MGKSWDKSKGGHAESAVWNSTAALQKWPNSTLESVHIHAVIHINTPRETLSHWHYPHLLESSHWTDLHSDTWNRCWPHSMKWPKRIFHRLTYMGSTEPEIIYDLSLDKWRCCGQHYRKGWAGGLISDSKHFTLSSGWMSSQIIHPTLEAEALYVIDTYYVQES